MGLCSLATASQQCGVKPYPSTKIPALQTAPVRGTLQPQTCSPAPALIIPVLLKDSAGAGTRDNLSVFVAVKSTGHIQERFCVMCCIIKAAFYDKYLRWSERELVKPLALTRNRSPD